MTSVFLHLLNNAIMAGLIVPVVLAMRLLFFRASKRLRVVLWSLIALRLLLPVSVESSLSLMPRTEVVALAPADVGSPDETSERIAVDAGIDFINDTVNSHAVQSRDFVRICGVVWLCGFACMLSYALIRCLLLRRNVRASIETEPGVFVCDELSNAFVCGMFRPRIYLPSGLDTQTRACVLAHERAHLKRYDFVWKPFAFLLLSVYWFHPLLWISYLLFCRDMELACDERAVLKLNADEKACYCDALLRFSRARRPLRRSLSFCAAPVKMRIRTVLRDRKPSKLWNGVGALAVFAAAICFLTVPKAVVPSPFPDLNSEEQLYGNWTLDRLEYREYQDGPLRTVHREQLDSRLHITFLSGGVVELCSRADGKNAQLNYQVSGNQVTIQGKESTDAGVLRHFIQAIYDPETDSINISVRSLATQTYTRSGEPIDSGFADESAASERTHTMSSYR